MRTISFPKPSGEEAVDRDWSSPQITRSQSNQARDVAKYRAVYSNARRSLAETRNSRKEDIGTNSDSVYIGKPQTKAQKKFSDAQSAIYTSCRKVSKEKDMITCWKQTMQERAQMEAQAQAQLEKLKSLDETGVSIGEGGAGSWAGAAQAMRGLLDSLFDSVASEFHIKEEAGGLLEQIISNVLAAEGALKILRRRLGVDLSSLQDSEAQLAEDERVLQEFLQRIQGNADSMKALLSKLGKKNDTIADTLRQIICDLPLKQLQRANSDVQIVKSNVLINLQESRKQAEEAAAAEAAAAQASLLDGSKSSQLPTIPGSPQNSAPGHSSPSNSNPGPGQLLAEVVAESKTSPKRDSNFSSNDLDAEAEAYMTIRSLGFSGSSQVDDEKIGNLAPDNALSPSAADGSFQVDGKGFVDQRSGQRVPKTISENGIVLPSVHVPENSGDTDALSIGNIDTKSSNAHKLQQARGKLQSSRQSKTTCEKQGIVHLPSVHGSGSQSSPQGNSIASDAAPFAINVADHVMEDHEQTQDSYSVMLRSAWGGSKDVATKDLDYDEPQMMRSARAIASRAGDEWIREMKKSARRTNGTLTKDSLLRRAAARALQPVKPRMDRMNNIESVLMDRKKVARMVGKSREPALASIVPEEPTVSAAVCCPFGVTRMPRDRWRARDGVVLPKIVGLEEEAVAPPHRSTHTAAFYSQKPSQEMHTTRFGLHLVSVNE